MPNDEREPQEAAANSLRIQSDHDGCRLSAPRSGWAICRTSQISPCGPVEQAKPKPISRVVFDNTFDFQLFVKENHPHALFDLI
jgi:hypothetical protein